MKRVIFIIVALFMCSVMASYADNAGEASNSKAPETIISAANAGASYYIKQNSFACATEAAFDELIRACNRKDQKALETLAARGTHAVLKQGSQVDLIKIGLGKCRVQAIPYKGTYFYVVTEHVGRR